MSKITYIDRSSNLEYNYTNIYTDRRYVGDTTFGPVAEGARRQGSKNIEANGSEHRRFPPSLVFGCEDEDSRGPVDGSVTAGSK